MFFQCIFIFKMWFQNYNIGTVHCYLSILVLIFKYFSIDSNQFEKNTITEKIIFLSRGKTKRIKYGCPVYKVNFCKDINYFSYFHSLSSTKNVKKYLITNNELKENSCLSIVENFQLDHANINEQDLDMLMSDSTEDFDNLFNENENKKTIMCKIVGKMGGQGNSFKGDEIIDYIVEQDLTNDTQDSWDEELDINHCEDKSDDEDDVEEFFSRNNIIYSIMIIIFIHI